MRMQKKLSRASPTTAEVDGVWFWLVCYRVVGESGPVQRSAHAAASCA